MSAILQTVVPIGHNRLTVIASKIEAAHARVTKGGVEWVEGSLELAAAMLAGRDSMPANVTFGQWLKDHKLDFYGKNDRGALIGLGSDLNLAREILTKTNTHCYQNIWKANKSRFPRDRTTTTRRRNSRPREYRKGRADLHRRMKLGDDLVDKLKGTTLDRAEEVAELVVLNRGAPEGEHTEIVKQLVADAVAGKDVSALAYTASLGTSNRKKPSLIGAWRKRMTASWELATYSEQNDLIVYLMEHQKPKTSGVGQ